MKNKTKVALIDLSAGFLWFAAFILLCVYAVFSLKAGGVSAVLISVAGAAVNYCLFVFFHESGHVIFSANTALKPQKINFGLFTVDCRFCGKSDGKNGGDRVCDKNKKIKFSLFSGEAGVTEFAYFGNIGGNKKNRDIKSDLKTVTAGGIVFSLIYCAAAFAVMVFVKNAAVFCLFGAGACSAFYLFTINVLPVDKTNDGSLVLFDDYCASLADMLEFSYLAGLNESEKIKKRFCEKNDNENNKKGAKNAFDAYILYEIDCAEDDVESAISRFDDFLTDKKLNKLSDEEYYLIFSEIVFTQCVKSANIGGGYNKNDDASKLFLTKNKTRIENFFASQTGGDCFSTEDFSDGFYIEKLKILRAHYAYRVFAEEKEWAGAIKNSYEKEFKNAVLQNAPENEYFLQAEKNLSSVISSAIL